MKCTECGIEMSATWTNLCGSCWEDRLSGKLDAAEGRIRELEALLADVRRAWYGDGSIVEMARLNLALGSQSDGGSEHG